MSFAKFLGRKKKLPHFASFESLGIFFFILSLQSGTLKIDCPKI